MITRNGQERVRVAPQREPSPSPSPSWQLSDVAQDAEPRVAEPSISISHIGPVIAGDAEPARPIAEDVVPMAPAWSIPAREGATPTATRAGRELFRRQLLTGAHPVFAMRAKTRVGDQMSVRGTRVPMASAGFPENRWYWSW